MLFPELGPSYYSEKDKGLKARMEAFYAESVTINQSFWQEADTDTRFFAGDQTLFNEMYGNLTNVSRRRQFQFNRIMRNVNVISGHQSKNRKSTICIPISNGNDETADQFTKVLSWVHRQENVLQTISDSFRGALITGLNLLHVWMDYRSDPVSGDIKVDNCSYNSFLIDPFFRKKDLSDCNAIWKRSYVSHKEAISLLPAYADQIVGMVGNNNMGDSKFQFMPEAYGYGKQNLLTYDEFYYRDYRSQEMLVDSQTGETMEWRGQDPEMLKRYLKQYPQVTVVKQQIPTVKLAIVLQGKVFYDAAQPMGIDSYPFCPVFAYFQPEMPYYNFRVQGIVRGLRDSQYLYNRRKVIELDILESQANAGWLYKENALVNPRDVWEQVGQGRGIAIKDEYQINEAVQKIETPGIPASMIELSKILGEEINQISGVSEELLGFDNKDTLSGYHAMLKQSASTTTLQVLFDQLDFSQKMLGKIMIDLIQANFTPGKVQNILNGEQPAQQFYNKDFGKYDAAVEEGLNTTTQKQMQFAQLLQMREAGIPVPNDVLLEASTMQNKKELIEAIEKEQQQAQQMQQAQMQQSMELQQAQAELARARAAADQGLGLERISRVEENQALAVERRAQAIRDEDAGLLDKVRALKELEELDITHLEKLISLSQMLKMQDNQSVTEKEDNKTKVAEGVLAQQASAQPSLNQGE